MQKYHSGRFDSYKDLRSLCGMPESPATNIFSVKKYCLGTASQSRLLARYCSGVRFLQKLCFCAGCQNRTGALCLGSTNSTTKLIPQTLLIEYNKFGYSSRRNRSEKRILGASQDFLRSSIRDQKNVQLL